MADFEFHFGVIRGALAGYLEIIQEAGLTEKAEW
jgi:hypothetical protein